MSAPRPPSPSPTTIFPKHICSAICHGDDWKILEANQPLGDFLQSNALIGESLCALLYQINLSAAVDALQTSKPCIPAFFLVEKKSFSLLWAPLEEKHLCTAEKNQDNLRFLLFHETAFPSDIRDNDLLWKEHKVILDSIYDGIWVIDANGMTVHINKALDRIAGIKPKDVVGKHVTVPMREGKFTSCVTLKALEKRKPITMFDDYAGGKRCLNTSTPIFDDSGKIWRVVASIRDISELEVLQAKLSETEREAQHYRKKLAQIDRSTSSGGLIGSSNSMRICLQQLEKAAKTTASMLILGETGTGKTLAASFVHNKSARSKGPFVSLNCAAIPPSLLETELFGYDKGAFTGASNEGKKGVFELARNGTLFLDEIGELPLSMQAKLLHVLDGYTFRRVGGIKDIKTDVRIMAATNKPLEQLVGSGEFRADLYYRLHILNVTIPPLRERVEDIPELAVYFLDEACGRQETAKHFDNKVLHRFQLHPWPGNVRELKATVEFLAAMTEGHNIKLRHLPPHLAPHLDIDEPGMPGNKQTLKLAMDKLEAQMIKDALAKTGSTYKAAALLGISQSSVVRKAQKARLAIPAEMLHTH